MKEPHPSQKMLEWEHTIICISSTPRFGKIRKCEYCEHEQAETVAGKAIHDELLTECSCQPE
jgi:hypothetical protein